MSALLASGVAKNTGHSGRNSPKALGYSQGIHVLIGYGNVLGCNNVQATISSVVRGMASVLYIYVTLYKKTRHKSQFPIGHNAHIKVKSSFCFSLKVKFTNGDKVKSVRDSAVLSTALYSAVCILISSVKASFSPK